MPFSLKCHTQSSATIFSEEKRLPIPEIQIYDVVDVRFGRAFIQDRRWLGYVHRVIRQRDVRSISCGSAAISPKLNLRNIFGAGQSYALSFLHITVPSPRVC